MQVCSELIPTFTRHTATYTLPTRLPAYRAHSSNSSLLTIPLVFVVNDASEGVSTTSLLIPLRKLYLPSLPYPTPAPPPLLLPLSLPPSCLPGFPCYSRIGYSSPPAPCPPFVLACPLGRPSVSSTRASSAAAGAPLYCPPPASWRPAPVRLLAPQPSPPPLLPLLPPTLASLPITACSLAAYPVALALPLCAKASYAAP